MPITVACPSCQARFNAPDSSAGKRAKCRRCNALMMIPIPQATLIPSNTLPQPSVEDVNQAMLAAIKAGDVAMLQTLLDRGANVNANVTPSGESTTTLLDAAEAWRQAEAAQLIRSYSGVRGEPDEPMNNISDDVTAAISSAVDAHVSKKSGRTGSSTSGTNGSAKSSQLAAKRERVKLPFILLLCLAVLLIAASLPLMGIGYESSSWKAIGGGVLLFLFGLGLCSVFVDAIRLRCPRCGIWNAGEVQQSVLVDRKYGTQKVYRNDEHWSTAGRHLGTTKRVEEELVTTDTHVNLLRCKHCGHEWEKLSKTKT